uniref:Zinc finger protein Xfin n=1 Tax=Zeugodacus cucurbitae TaxID=28588 RepID=A0A0A1XDI0_ZEUCU
MNFRVNISICRVCMKPDDGVSLLDNVELCEKFMFTTRLKLVASDDMPSLICNKCLKRLRVSYDFVKSAHDSEKNLKAFLQKISKDFQLVTNNTNGKSNNNEDEDDDDDLLANILDEENVDKKTAEATQKDENAVSSSELTNSAKTNVRKKAIGKTENNVGQRSVTTTRSTLSETSIQEKKMKLNVNRESVEKEMKSYEAFESDIQVELEDNLEDITKCDIEEPKETSSEHEIQILEYTDEESQTELEILEENLQPSDDTRSSLGAEEPQPQSSGGFLKEYQAMLEEEDGEFLDDKDDINDKTTTAKELSFYDGDEELLDEQDIEMKSMVEDNLDEERSVGTSTQLQTQAAEKDTKSKTRKYQTKTHVRGASAKPTKKGDSLNTSKRFLCLKCNRDFSTKTNLTRHMATHEGNRPFQCTVCSKSFTQNVSLKQHMYTHTGEKPYQCDVCHRGFTQCKSLVFHIRRHTGDKPFPCEKCGALFRQKDGLKTHILKRHTIKSQHGNMELTTCAICKEVFGDKILLQEHMKKHLNDYVRVDSAMSCANRDTEENFEYIDDDLPQDKANDFMGETGTEITDDIGSAAHVVDLMTTSALEPSRAKKFQCRKCFKCFAIKKNLLRHLTTHELSVETDFVCKICELCFATSEDLQTHTLNEHTDSNESFQCELCDATFYSIEELRKHSALHNAKSFKTHTVARARNT